MFTRVLIILSLFPTLLWAEESKSEKRQKLIKELCTSFQESANQCKLVQDQIHLVDFNVQNVMLGSIGPMNMSLNQVKKLYSTAKANYSKNPLLAIEQEIMNAYLDHASAHQKYIKSIPPFFKAVSEYAPEALKDFYAQKPLLTTDKNSQDACNLSEELSHVMARAQSKYRDLYSQEFDQLESIHDLTIEYGEESHKLADSHFVETEEKRQKVEELSELHAAFLELESRYLKMLHMADYKHTPDFLGVRGIVRNPLEGKYAKENKLIQGYLKSLELLKVKTELNSSVTEAYRQIENYDAYAFEYFKQYCYEEGKHVEWKDLSIEESSKLMQTKKLIPALKYCQKASVKDWLFERSTVRPGTFVYVYDPKEKKLLEVLPLERIVNGNEDLPLVLEYSGELSNMDSELLKKYPLLGQFRILRYIDCPGEITKMQFSFGEVQEKLVKREGLLSAYEDVYIARREKEKKGSDIGAGVRRN